MYQFVKVEPDYTGGGIYCFIGIFDNNKYFIASDLEYDVRIIDTNPFNVEYDDLWDADWQEKHLVEDLMGNNRLEFFKDMLNWIKENKPFGNYACEEFETRLEDIENRLKGE